MPLAAQYVIGQERQQRLADWHFGSIQSFFTCSLNNKRHPCCRKPHKQRVDPTATANHRFKPCIRGFPPAMLLAGGRPWLSQLGGLCLSCSLTALCWLEAHNSSVYMAWTQNFCVSSAAFVSSTKPTPTWSIFGVCGWARDLHWHVCPSPGEEQVISPQFTRNQEDVSVGRRKKRKQVESPCWGAYW